ncbi:hypothetical protein K7432_013782 [Basidiobolus ranarum]|uniref:Uncharacterized protein n=1 Tax=Basidiobolus ranarum TaxID=34480 RepID=A0ABR2WIN2_9FUNG
MKFFNAVLLVSSLASLGFAQNSSDLAGCVSKCDANDVSCKAQCLGITFPSGDAAPAVQRCVSQCDNNNPNLPACLKSCVSSSGASPGTDGVKGEDSSPTPGATDAVISSTLGATGAGPVATNPVASASSALGSIASSGAQAASSVISSATARATEVRSSGNHVNSNPMIYGMIGVLVYKLQN